MSRHHYFFGLIRIPLEICIVVGAFWIARDIRITTDLIPGIQLPTRTMDTWYLLAVASMSYLIIGTIFAFQKLYILDRFLGIVEESFTIIKSISVGFFIAIGIIYLTNGFPYETILIPRLILIYAFIMIGIGILIERIFLRSLRTFGFIRGWFPKRNILLIMHHSEDYLERIFLAEKHLNVIGYLAPFSGRSHFSYLGTIAQHITIIPKHTIDEVIVLSHDLPYEMRKMLFEYCQVNGIMYRYVGNPYETAKNNAHIDFVGRIPLVEIRTIGITAWGRVMKRCFDIVLGAFLLIFLSPLWLILSLLILLESPGFPLYISYRVGRGGGLFRMLKFRSMVQNADQMKESFTTHERIDGPLFKLTNDPRVTKFGRWIRRWSIDEIPQIINVLRGDMSFIGPRPHLPDEVAKYGDKQRQVLTIKPGITGMAQVYGRDRNSFDREIELDLFYIENWSLLLDTKILFLTFGAIFYGK